MSARSRIDVSALPEISYGANAPLWWGTAVMMAIEGMMFLLLVASYFYLHFDSRDWPPRPIPPPDLFLPSVNVGLLLLSLLPMYLSSRYARRDDPGRTKLWIVIGIVMGIASILLRWREFHTLHCQWSTNAYGSIIWTTLGLHLTHLLASTVESIVLACWLFICGLDDKHRLDTQVNSFYWYFVVISWIPLYAMIYLAPRFL